MFTALIKELRPKQWAKNLIIAGPVIFSENLFNPDKLLFVALAMALFSSTASTVYLVNDLADLEKDRLHPEKRFRPLASGALSVPAAVIVAVILGIGSLTAAFALSGPMGAILLLYLATNLLYSFRLKHVVLLDAMLLALGFVLRVLAGAVVIAVPASEWLIVCTYLLALFLGFAKRRHELTLLAGGAQHHRKVLEEYSPYFLDQMITVVAAATVMSYALYTVAPQTVQHFGSSSLIYTVPFVLYGIFRYLFLVHRRASGGDPTKVFLTDRPTIVNVGLWLLTTIGIIYYKDIAALVG